MNFSSQMHPAFGAVASEPENSPVPDGGERETGLQMADEPMHIFIVDDDESVRESLSLLAESMGWEAEAFASGDDFLQAYHDDSAVGCLVLDLQMPGMTGPELQQALKARGIELPVIAITAHADSDLARQALAAGARTVLRKPFDDQALIEQIEQTADPRPH